ncbi:hypothetical protein ACLBYA_30755, partial [Mycobacterium sp. C31M]
REHHLIKTLNTGWTPTAHSDGSTTWAAPTGHTYTTRPLASVLFPHNSFHTEIPRRRHISLIDNHDREPTIPTRQRTRKHDREYRINAERTRNALEIALEQNRQRHHRQGSGGDRQKRGRPNTTYTDNDPPPF